MDKKESIWDVNFSMNDTVFDSLTAHLAILDENGTILSTNRAWNESARKRGNPCGYDVPGENYLQVCRKIMGNNRQKTLEIIEGIQGVIDGSIGEFCLEYPLHTPGERIWYYIRVMRLSARGALKLLVSHEDITGLKLAQEALRLGEESLKKQKKILEEKNIALKVLLEQREADKIEMEQNVLTNVKETILPYLERLKAAPLRKEEQKIVDIIDSQLMAIISPFMNRLSHAGIFLTPQELQVATLVKEGKPSKEIADILYISKSTVHFHRKNIRKKLGISDRKKNLRFHLMALS
ncbi:regulatory protein, luxR family [Desulfocicer vacuolatum DSM 3385]|uniref:Regulatory protein, luxR family n=1 Tax=Desulfocicer vacuolatum DSM 3385 TaxID=1121400 RepID=A0A1W1YN19_9BACT|nr:helix-turn-helix transcriptional regulator [Desulfocicer vacuolatum]SMC37559.1 regulatory protein, luxR family [Desulfocicer vacuolatum DSM 3385]